MSHERPKAPQNVSDVLSMLTDAMKVQRQRGLPRMAPAQIRRIETLLTAVQEHEQPGSTTMSARERYLQASGASDTMPVPSSTAASSSSQEGSPAVRPESSSPRSASSSRPLTTMPSAAPSETSLGSALSSVRASSAVEPPERRVAAPPRDVRPAKDEADAYVPPDDAPWMIDESRPPASSRAAEPPRAAATSVVPAPSRSARPSQGLRVESLDELRDVIGNCRRCGLCESRRSIVFGEGNPRARLMIIGEAPSMGDDEAGRPFVDAAGELLDGMLRAMTLARDDVYMTNIVKCRPPNNRAPERDELRACAQFLRPAIESVRPDVILTLGNEASKLLLGGGFDFANRRGEWGAWEGVDVMPTWHPAHLLLKPEEKRSAWHDLQKVMARMGLQR